MRILVLGAGVSGKAAAGLAHRLGHSVVGFDEDPVAAAAARASGLSFTGGEWDRALLETADLVVASPGIPPDAPMVVDARAARLPVWSELEFGFRHAAAPLLAVTGTNGKTTAVTAAAAMLEASGAKVCAAGNIGTALSEVAQEAWDVIVVEASSFQLHFTERFHPIGAAILNVAPDHLDWHGSYEEYAAAKRAIFANQQPADVLAYGVDDAGARRAVTRAPSRVVPVSGDHVPDGGAGVSGKTLRVAGHEFPTPEVGPDFLADLVAAAVLAHHAQATEQGIREALGRFRTGPHRRAVIGRWDGVEWVDDSKATNPHAAAAATAAYDSVVLIAGGRNKGLDLAPMAAMPGVRHVITMGESAAELGALFDEASVTRVSGMDEAVSVADRIAEPGDTILLAPGCASFDMYPSYGARGDAFRAAARRLKGGA